MSISAPRFVSSSSSSTSSSSPKSGSKSGESVVNASDASADIPRQALAEISNGSSVESTQQRRSFLLDSENFFKYLAEKGGCNTVPGLFDDPEEGSALEGAQVAGGADVSLQKRMRQEASSESVSVASQENVAFGSFPKDSFLKLESFLTDQCSRLGKENGEGTFGEIYLGLGVVYKVQFITEQTEREVGFLEKFRDLHHPNLMGFFDIGRFSEKIVISMPKLDGDLFGLISEVQLNPSEIHTIFSQVAGAVGFINGVGFVHRDLKPDNVLIQQGFGNVPESYHVQLCDFGCATEINNKEELFKVVGTLNYFPPESVDLYRESQRRSLKPKNELKPYTVCSEVSCLLYLLATITFSEVPHLDEDGQLIEDKRIKGGIGFSLEDRIDTSSDYFKAYSPLCNFIDNGLTPAETGANKYPTVEAMMGDFNKLPK